MCVLPLLQAINTQTYFPFLYYPQHTFYLHTLWKFKHPFHLVAFISTLVSDYFHHDPSFSSLHLGQSALLLRFSWTGKLTLGSQEKWSGSPSNQPGCLVTLSSGPASSQTTRQPNHKTAQVLQSETHSAAANPFIAAYSLLIFITEMSVVNFLF